jgi:ABC-type nickel/cobalt efflux system permease component RcnA
MGKLLKTKLASRWPVWYRPDMRPLRLLWITLVVMMVCGLNTASVRAQNPFTGKPSSSQAATVTVPAGGILEKIALWQNKIRLYMADQLTMAKTERSLRPLILLIGLAFCYGALHAAGPGHGKALALSYMLSRRRKVADAVLFGNGVAFFHGLSGIIFVLIVRLILQRSVSAGLTEVTRITQVASFSLILGLGVFLFIQGVMDWIKRAQPALEADRHLISRQKGPLATALVVGMIPCPGVVMVMLFALSLDLLALGVFLAGAIALGMSVTITAIVLITVAGKKMAIVLAAQHSGLIRHFEYAIHAVAGLAIALLGGLFLASAIAN